ncbi:MULTISPECIES: flagellar hook-basal body complex protein FliE [Cytobacillus]|uniref:flagellar hook-basal body complex protein FliE n=1 Tax=Cytobacillus TaxID=2675230 RepID=UPI001CD5CE4D|nr:flagellar hook-basal body complex protein FliE [Cytobacillus kochii]MCA1028465.1 flagellar hook-basal body complex protein FliE [Cytobacillus kochii]MCM3321713.1 flagellar hook-basal body complex protein FliE [Cytobacillus kochii]MCM3343453.1 flagellar hook-basal body complex protein FliE [Cytobacillus kochii]MDM5207284.1 flagellar hook-basal body complex protein FliE [Cytobacillus kochii]
MNINSFSPVVHTNSPDNAQNVKEITPSDAHNSFASALKSAIDSVNERQISSDEMTTKLATGQDVDLHDVMITAQKASVSMSLTLEVRNKAVEAYQEMMRMQV